MNRLLLLPPLTLSALSACQGASPDERPSTAVSIAVAPLTLEGVEDACYDVEVRNDVGETVWRRERLCASRFGNGLGDVSYVGPCDAQDNDGNGSAVNTVTLALQNIYTDTANPDDWTENAIDPATWRNPCGVLADGGEVDTSDGVGPCQLSVQCVENADAPVTFNVTIMRDARQGFFDLAVDFDAIFCSAKFDTCDGEEADSRPIQLLFDAEGERTWTGVFGFACSAGPGADVETQLMYSNVQVVCDNNIMAEIPPHLPEGVHTMPMANGLPLAFGIYRGTESLSCGPDESCNKVYWNLAIDLAAIEAAGGNCHLQLAATATDLAEGDFAGGLPTDPGMVWPWIQVHAPLTYECEAFCQVNPLDGCEVEAGLPAANCESDYQQYMQSVDAPISLEAFIAAVPCNSECVFDYLKVIEALPLEEVPLIDVWAAENCKTCAVQTVYHGGTLGSPHPAMCYESTGFDASAIVQPGFPTTSEILPVLEPATECASLTASAAAILAALDPGNLAVDQWISLGPVDEACLPEGSLLAATVETSLKMFEVDASGPWAFFTPAGVDPGRGLEMLASIETSLKFLEAAGLTTSPWVQWSTDLDFRSFMASVETYLKYAEATGSTLQTVFGASCSACGVVSSIETYLKYAEAVGNNLAVPASHSTSGPLGTLARTIGSIETFLKYAEAAGLTDGGTVYSGCDGCDLVCHAAGSVESYLKYAEAMGLTQSAAVPADIGSGTMADGTYCDGQCASPSVIASVETYLKYAEAVGLTQSAAVPADIGSDCEPKPWPIVGASVETFFKYAEALGLTQSAAVPADIGSAPPTLADAHFIGGVNVWKQFGNIAFSHVPSVWNPAPGAHQIFACEITWAQEISAETGGPAGTLATTTQLQSLATAITPSGEDVAATLAAFENQDGIRYHGASWAVVTQVMGTHVDGCLGDGNAWGDCLASLVDLCIQGLVTMNTPLTQYNSLAPVPLASDVLLARGFVSMGAQASAFAPLFLPTFNPDVGGDFATALLDKGLVLDGFAVENWVTASVSMAADDIIRFLDKGFVTTGAPDLTWVVSNSVEVRDRLQDKGIAGCHSGPPEEMFADVYSIAEAGFVPGETYDCSYWDWNVFPAVRVEQTCERTLADVVDRLLDKGIASEGLDITDLPGTWSTEQIDRILDKGIVACGVSGVEEVVAAAEAAHVPGETRDCSYWDDTLGQMVPQTCEYSLAEVLDRILDKGALHGWQTTPMRDAWPHLGFGMNLGVQANDAMIDPGAVVTGANQPIWRWLLGLGFSTSAPPPSQWGTLLDRGLAITIENGEAVLRSVENWLLLNAPTP